MTSRDGGAMPDGPGAEGLLPIGTPEERHSARRKRRVRQALLISVSALLGLTLLAAGGVYFVGQQLTGNVDRVPGVFANLDENARPDDSDNLTFLLVGLDSRSEEQTTGAGATADEQVSRSDVIMLVTVNEERTKASVVSLPRDSWVDIPGRGKDKINASYAFGGPPLLIQTVENLTRVRVDHFAVIDFVGFQAMTDAVGGIEVNAREPTSNYGITIERGINQLDGREALAYVRERKNLPGGDLDRAKRQQNVLRALLNKAISGQTFSDPRRTFDLLNAIGNYVSIDDTLSNAALQSLAFSMRNIRGSDVTFLTAPTAGTGMEGPQSVVYLDSVRGPLLWQAVNTGTVERYAQQNRNDELGGAPS